MFAACRPTGSMLGIPVLTQQAVGGGGGGGYGDRGGGGGYDRGGGGGDRGGYGGVCSPMWMIQASLAGLQPGGISL